MCSKKDLIWPSPLNVVFAREMLNPQSIFLFIIFLWRLFGIIYLEWVECECDLMTLEILFGNGTVVVKGIVSRFFWKCLINGAIWGVWKE